MSLERDAVTETVDTAKYQEFMQQTGNRVAVDQGEERAWREEHRPAFEAAASRGEWAPDWLQKESATIRQAAEIAVPTAEIELAHAYWNGRRESYNSVREGLISNQPTVAADLPPAIQVDEIRIRQQVLDQQQDRSLATAR